MLLMGSKYKKHVFVLQTASQDSYVRFSKTEQASSAEEMVGKHWSTAVCFVLIITRVLKNFVAHTCYVVAVE